MDPLNQPIQASARQQMRLKTALDTNADGKIALAEVAAQADTDGSGTLSEAERKALADTLRDKGVEPDLAKKVSQSADFTVGALTFESKASQPDTLTPNKTVQAKPYFAQVDTPEITAEKGRRLQLPKGDRNTVIQVACDASKLTINTAPGVTLDDTKGKEPRPVTYIDLQTKQSKQGIQLTFTDGSRAIVPEGTTVSIENAQFKNGTVNPDGSFAWSDKRPDQPSTR